MEDRETARMHKYGESKTTRIMMATVPHVTYGLGLRKFQADGFLLTQTYMVCFLCWLTLHNCIKKHCTKKRNAQQAKQIYQYKNIKEKLDQTNVAIWY